MALTTLYGTFNVQIDLPVVASALQTLGMMAYIIQQAQLPTGNNTDSTITISSVKPNSSVALPQKPGFQLYSYSVQAAVPANVPNIFGYESYLAGIIVAFLYSIKNQKYPTNLLVTMTQVPVSLTNLPSPTPPNGTIFQQAIPPGSDSTDLPVFPKRYIL